MLYCVIRDKNKDEKANIFYNYEELNKETFSPMTEIVNIIELGSIQGKTYQEKKAAARNKAIEYSSNIFPGLSWGECALLCDYFEKIGSRYGLLREFRENAII